MVMQQMCRTLTVSASQEPDNPLQSEKFLSRFPFFEDRLARYNTETDLQKKNPRRQARVVLGGAQHATERREPTGRMDGPILHQSPEHVKRHL